jgi:hypothetical protein
LAAGSPPRRTSRRHSAAGFGAPKRTASHNVRCCHQPARQRVGVRVERPRQAPKCSESFISLPPSSRSQWGTEIALGASTNTSGGSGPVCIAEGLGDGGASGRAREGGVLAGSPGLAAASGFFTALRAHSGLTSRGFGTTSGRHFEAGARPLN